MNDWPYWLPGQETSMRNPEGILRPRCGLPSTEADVLPVRARVSFMYTLNSSIIPLLCAERKSSGFRSSCCT
jgi:hypothetical protein